MTTVIQQIDKLDLPSDENNELPVDVRISRFCGASGVEEFQIIIHPNEYADFSTQLSWIEEAYAKAVKSIGLDMDTAIWRRFMCSDLINQSDLLRLRPFSNPDDSDELCAISWVGQDPATPAKVGMWAHHIFDPSAPLKKSKSGRTLTLDRGELKHHWTIGLTDDSVESSYDQTHGIFNRYQKILDRNEITLFDNVIRTWFFVQNVDSNYAGLVTARNEVFDKQNLTADTHYIASTGIEGNYDNAATKATLDSYAIGGVKAEQIQQLYALDYLSPTHIYGVAFERATAVHYQDRSQIFLSGTASIDDEGEVVHPGNVLKQLDRTIINIEALLAESNATINDMQVFIVYLRDANDSGVISEAISRRFPKIPFEIVTAPVCRPGWLIEIEGLAIAHRKFDASLPAY